MGGRQHLIVEQDEDGVVATHARTLQDVKHEISEGLGAIYVSDVDVCVVVDVVEAPERPKTATIDVPEHAKEGGDGANSTTRKKGRCLPGRVGINCVHTFLSTPSICIPSHSPWCILTVQPLQQAVNMREVRKSTSL